MIGIIGRKIGMTQLFREDGTRIPVTVLSAGPCPVLQVKTAQKDGYEAIQLGYGEKKERSANKPLKGHLKRSGSKPVRFIKEIRLDKAGGLKEGQSIKVDSFEVGDLVDVTGISIGKGFQGGMKRWGWAGGKGSHGSMHHRQPGSIGASSFPSRVTKGHQMAGRMGGERVTIQHLEVIEIDAEKNLIAVKGSVPGNENSYLIIRNSVKRPVKERKKVEEGSKEEAKPAKEDKKPVKGKEEKAAGKGAKKDEKAKK
jgi:large subunit ribosomal protein L3